MVSKLLNEKVNESLQVKCFLLIYNTYITYNIRIFFLRCRGPNGNGTCQCDAGYTGNGTHCTGQFFCSGP